MVWSSLNEEEDYELPPGIDSEQSVTKIRKKRLAIDPFDNRVIDRLKDHELSEFLVDFNLLAEEYTLAFFIDNHTIQDTYNLVHRDYSTETVNFNVTRGSVKKSDLYGLIKKPVHYPELKYLATEGGNLTFMSNAPSRLKRLLKVTQAMAVDFKYKLRVNGCEAYNFEGNEEFNYEINPKGFKNKLTQKVRPYIILACATPESIPQVEELAKQLKDVIAQYQKPKKQLKVDWKYARVLRVAPNSFPSKLDDYIIKPHLRQEWRVTQLQEEISVPEAISTLTKAIIDGQNQNRRSLENLTEAIGEIAFEYEYPEDSKDDQ